MEGSYRQNSQDGQPAAPGMMGYDQQDYGSPDEGGKLSRVVMRIAMYEGEGGAD